MIFIHFGFIILKCIITELVSTNNNNNNNKKGFPLVLQQTDDVFVFIYRGSRSQAAASQPLQLFCHLSGQSLQVAPSIFLITHPDTDTHTHTLLQM